MLCYETLDCLNILEMLMEVFKQSVNPVRFRLHILIHFLWPLVPLTTLLCTRSASWAVVAVLTYVVQVPNLCGVNASGFTHMQLGGEPRASHIDLKDPSSS